ncbi:MAG: hypothetical protein ACFB2Z_03580 [Maricaulaceae bacterium]
MRLFALIVGLFFAGAALAASPDIRVHEKLVDFDRKADVFVEYLKYLTWTNKSDVEAVSKRVEDSHLSFQRFRNKEISGLEHLFDMCLFVSHDLSETLWKKMRPGALWEGKDLFSEEIVLLDHIYYSGMSCGLWFGFNEYGAAARQFLREKYPNYTYCPQPLPDFLADIPWWRDEMRPEAAVFVQYGLKRPDRLKEEFIDVFLAEAYVDLGYIQLDGGPCPEPKSASE